MTLLLLGVKLIQNFPGKNDSLLLLGVKLIQKNFKIKLLKISESTRKCTKYKCMKKEETPKPRKSQS
jgi:hypothetical protein